MTVGEFKILYSLNKWGPLAAAEIADEYGWPWQRASTKLTSMQKRGLVRRKLGDPASLLWEITHYAATWVNI